MDKLIVVVDKVEKEMWGDKPTYKLIDKGGEKYSIGKSLANRINELQSGVSVELIMDVYNNNSYIKDFSRCYDLSTEKLEHLSKPSKNIKDISIEAQVAVKAVTDIISSGKEVPQDIQDMTWEWIRKALKGALE